MAGTEDRLPLREVRELPEPPRNYWRLVGPGIVAGGVGLSSGEFVLWPYIASQVGLVLLWGALVGVVTQFFINMEVERYTLATGETVLTGFNRFWRHWGLLFAVMGYFANLWPGWAISSATLTSYLFGGNPTAIAVVTLLIIGFSLTFAPVVYVTLERSGSSTRYPTVCRSSAPRGPEDRSRSPHRLSGVGRQRVHYGTDAAG